MSRCGVSTDRVARSAIAAASVVVLLAACSGLAEGQGRTRLGVRGGTGLVSGSKPVYAGQLEIVDTDGASSVELALVGWTGLHLTGEYTAGELRPAHDYPEKMSVWGGGLMASYLWRHARRSGPYALVGIGVGPIWVDWRVDTTDLFFGTPVPGGSFRTQEGVMVGSLLSLGLGQRLLDRFDVRAQLITLIVPPTAAREDTRTLPMLTLTSGVGL